jgi:hypothetical protein
MMTDEEKLWNRNRRWWYEQLPGRKPGWRKMLRDRRKARERELEWDGAEIIEQMAEPPFFGDYI